MLNDTSFDSETFDTTAGLTDFLRSVTPAAKKKDTVTTADFYGEDKPLLIISYGLGRDSSSLLIRLATLGIRPDLVVFTDLAGEKKSSYDYLPVMNNFLRSVNFPEVSVIKLQRERDPDFEAHLFRLGIFASFNYGRRSSCSAEWKVKCANLWIEKHPLVIEARRQGRRIVRAVGFEAGEEYRIAKSDKKAAEKAAAEASCSRSASAFSTENSPYVTWFPLIEWKIDFDGVISIICEAEMPIPPKSSCYFCAAMTKDETRELSEKEPNLFFKGLVLEALAQRNKVVPHVGRVQGLRFGSKWSDYEFAAPFMPYVEPAIDVFDLDRRFEDGDRSKNNKDWKKKAARVEIFRACFSSTESYFSFVADENNFRETEREKVASRMREVTEEIRRSQKQLSLAF